MYVRAQQRGAAVVQLHCCELCEWDCTAAVRVVASKVASPVQSTSFARLASQEGALADVAFDSFERSRLPLRIPRPSIPRTLVGTNEEGKEGGWGPNLFSPNRRRMLQLVIHTDIHSGMYIRS